MTIIYKEIPEEKSVELYVEGKVTQEGFDRITGQLHQFIETHGKIKLLEVVQNFEGFDPSMLWDGIKFDMKHIPNISHCAVVSDIGWISPVAKAAGGFISTKLRTFSLCQLEEAKTWLRNPDTSKQEET